MDKDIFIEKFNKMLALCGFSVKRETGDYYYSELERVDEKVLMVAFKKLTEDPPGKMSIKVVWAFVSMARKDLNTDDAGTWTGAECEVEGCNMGLIHTEHRVFQNQPRYNYVWRCQDCRSNSTKMLEYYTPENVEILEKKLSKTYNPQPPQNALPPGDDRFKNIVNETAQNMEP